ncbi:MAG TPA: TonB-dependent receptor [Thermoanaerobaculia bacterium]|jgi:outer membrane receptor protein involved in Fe transport
MEGRKGVLLALLLMCALHAAAEEVERRASETITVTAAKVPEDATIVPAAITIIDGEELRARNATDLASALAAVGGVSIGPGGDAGPAGSVPELWGLREFDAFLLVVDNVPWGGAFNPDLPSLDMTNVERIEIIRGAAPVMFGATSFVGVIHVIHRDPGAPGFARASAGSYRSGSAAVSIPLSQLLVARQSLNANVERRGFRDDDTSSERAHLLYRAARQLANGTLHLDVDGSLLRQDPASPHLREGAALSTRTPLDANYNPAGARLDQNRLQGTLRWEGTTFALPAAVTLAVTHSNVQTTRGFVTDIAGSRVAAAGYEQDRDVDEVYFDAHLVKSLTTTFRVIAGVDHLFGRANGASDLFTYTAALSGGDASSRAPSGENEFRETRNFSGAYGVAEWNASGKLRLDAGLRLNHTRQHRRAEDERDARTDTRLSGSAGINYLLYNFNNNKLALFADYRDAFKPAATDFGPDVEADILEPEDARSFEAGVKGAAGEGRLLWQAAAFDLDFTNVVVATVRNGLPALENGGQTRFRGVDVDVDFLVTGELRAKLGYGYHDARFGDFVQSFGGVPTQLRGRRFEMSPFHLAGAALVFAPEGRHGGPIAHVGANYVGERYLNKRNTALADAYTTWSAGAGWRFGRHELRIDARNLNDVRPPVAESELGDAQYYRLPSRTIDVTYRMEF